MKNKETKFYTKWWFWLILAIVFLGVLGMFIPTESDCNSCEQDLDLCIDSIEEFVAAWDDYQEILNEYCEIDYTNPLCNLE